MGDKEKLPWCFLNNGPSISFKTAPNKLLSSPAYAIVPTEIHIAFFKSFHKKELHSEALNDPPFEVQIPFQTHCQSQELKPSLYLLFRAFFIFSILYSLCICLVPSTTL